MKVLHLTLKKKWFDLIASGEKKEEYREVKDYWIGRLTNPNANVEHDGFDYKEFDAVVFRNGYSKKSSTVTVQHIETYYGEGKPEWGAEPGEEYFVIKLGKIIK